MRPLLLLLCCFTAARWCGAQIQSLSTNETGSEIDFVTSSRFRGSDQPFTPKLFRIGPRGLELVDQQAQLGRALDAAGTTFATNYYTPCDRALNCNQPAAHFTTFTTPSATYHFEGIGQVSANGRWGVTWGDALLHRLSSYRVDLLTGERKVVGEGPGGRPAVASDGTVLTFLDSQRIQLVRFDLTIDLPPLNRIYSSVLSDSGNVVAVGGRSNIFVWREGSDRFEDIGLGQNPSLSYDGARVAWLGPGEPGTGYSQAWFCFTAACQPRRITTDVEGVTQVILNGNGGLAIYVTGDNRIASVDTGNGFRSEYLGSAPAWTSAPDATVAGSAYEIRGTFPDDVEACSGDQCALRLYADRHRFRYQFPWNTPTGALGQPVVLHGGDAVWELLLHPGIDAVAPYSISFALHQDWRGPADEGDPARPGEVLHLYVLGLGPVDPLVPAGVASPVSPLAHCTLPLSFVAAPGLPNPGKPTDPAQMLYAGLAPGLIGVYQLDFRIPADWTDRYYELGVLYPPEPTPRSIALVHVRAAQ